MKGINYKLEEFLGPQNNSSGEAYVNAIKQHKNEVGSSTVGIGKS